MSRHNKSLAICCVALFVIVYLLKVYYSQDNKCISFIDIYSRTASEKEEISPGVDALWQPVPNTSSEIWVYSAFYEDREIERKHFEKSPAIRIISRSNSFQKPYGKLGIMNEVVCRFWYDEEETSNTISRLDLAEGNMEYIRENFGLNYTASFIFCPLTSETKIPTSVSVYAYADLKRDPAILPKAHNRLLVNSKKETKEPSAAMAACVAPIYGQYSKAWEVIEWIELNRLLGVNHFYLYSQNVTKNVSCVFKEYASKGLVTVLDWDGSPYKPDIGIRANNLFACFNDCLYRGMYRHKYLAFYDIDEFLMPKKHKDLLELMEDMAKKDKNMVSLTFRNTFFYLQWPDDPNANHTKLTTMKKTRRRTEFQPARARSKYICKPEETVEVGNHFLWETRTSEMKQVTLELDVGYSHHYRASCEMKEYGDKCLNFTSEVDTSMWKWKNALTEAMNQQNIGQVCGLTPVN